jgi:hypothetical protein
MSGAENGQAALWFQLAKLRVVGGNHNIDAKHYFDADRVANSRHGHHYGFRAPSSQGECINPVILIICR